MRINADTSTRARPARRNVAERVREMIRARGLRAGDLLPTYHEMRKALDVSYMTVKRGLDDLEAEGLISRIPSKGTFVTRELDLVPGKLADIGVILPSSRNQLFLASYLSEIMRGLAQDEPTVDFHIFSLRQDGLVNAAQINRTVVNGVVLLGLEDDDYLRTFAQWGLPGVVVDYCSTAALLDYVACDNRGAARQVVAYLAALGHRRVACAVPPSQKAVVRPETGQPVLLVRDSSDVRERRAESLGVLRESGLLAGEWPPRGTSAHWTVFAADELHRQKRRADRPTAVLTDSNYSARRLLEALAQRGVRVPEDVSVGTVASDGDAPFGEPRLSCCRFDFVGMGRKASELLADRCRKPRLKQPHVHRIGFEFVEGQTVGRANPS